MNNKTEQETERKLKSILNYLMEKRSFDFSGYHSEMLARRINLRLKATACKDFGSYLSYLKKDIDELDRLIDVITINVSRFFRDTLTFEIIADRILPALVREKARIGERSLRIWSAGCAMGEEPYSIAILIQELLEKEGLAMNLHIFATDIDKNVLKDAEKALYPLSGIEKIKYGLLIKYFTSEGASFRLRPEIKKLVTFSLYDMLDKKHGVPPESVFGNFDLALCRNLLIYFNPEYQNTIFEKLYNSLANRGYLILGEAETLSIKYRHHFERIIDFSPIYRKKQGG